MLESLHSSGLLYCLLPRDGPFEFGHVWCGHGIIWNRKDAEQGNETSLWTWVL
jgi:hypothetical protein